MRLSASEIRTKRKEEGINQKVFAKILGYSQKTLCQFEKGIANSTGIIVAAWDFFQLPKTQRQVKVAEAIEALKKV